MSGRPRAGHGAALVVGERTVWHDNSRAATAAVAQTGLNDHRMTAETTLTGRLFGR
jgi:hypothetical protein